MNMVTSETHHEPKYLRLCNKIIYKQLPTIILLAKNKREREWRRKMDDIWNRRNHGHVALQPKAFIFAQDLSAPACIASGHQKTVNTNLDML